MSHTISTDKQARQSNQRKWVAVLLLAAVAVFSIWLLATERSTIVTIQEEAPSESESVPQPAAELLIPRAPDQYASELDALRRQAVSVSRRDEVLAYTIQLEALAAAGRQAYIESRLPNTANAYSDYLDGLRRESMSISRASTVPADPNGFSQYLEELRRMEP